LEKEISQLLAHWKNPISSPVEKILSVPMFTHDLLHNLHIIYELTIFDKWFFTTY